MNSSMKIKQDFENEPKEELLYKGKYKKEEFKSLTTQQLFEEIDMVLGA